MIQLYPLVPEVLNAPSPSLQVIIISDDNDIGFAECEEIHAYSISCDGNEFYPEFRVFFHSNWNFHYVFHCICLYFQGSEIIQEMFHPFEHDCDLFQIVTLTYHTNIADEHGIQLALLRGELLHQYMNTSNCNTELPLLLLLHGTKCSFEPTS